MEVRRYRRKKKRGQRRKYDWGMEDKMENREVNFLVCVWKEREKSEMIEIKGLRFNHAIVLHG